MGYDPSKTEELYLLRAENFSEDITPNQKEYNLKAAKWLKEHDFDTMLEATQAMKNTEFYEGAGLAKIADDIEIRIKAAKEVGYDDVAKIHEERKEKFAQKGNAYAFSQEWITDLNKAAEISNQYAKRKEVFGKIFSGYFQIQTSPQQKLRELGAKEISEGLQELENLGVSFDELAQNRAYKLLTMTTDKGMDNFVSFVHEFLQQPHEDDTSDLAGEQERVAKWAKEHKSELVAIGKEETWHQANAIAVPSDDPSGYDFIEIREVDV